MTGDGNWKNPADSAGTDGAIEGQSPAENSTNTASHATRVAKKAKQKQIAATKTSRDSPSCCNTFHGTNSCTSYSFVNSANSKFPSSLAT